VGFFVAVKYSMIKIRHNSQRGFAHPPRTGLIHSYRSFSFEGYQDPRYIHWGPIKTINDDRTQPGFETTWHEHRHLDILSYVVSGSVSHKDNLGNELTARAGQVQHMWCGDSIWHSEANASTEPNRYLQIWIMYPADHTPLSMTAQYTLIDRTPGFSALPITLANKGITVYAGIMEDHVVTDGDSYLLVLEGSCKINGVVLEEGASAELYEQTLIERIDDTHIILFELNTI
jgi:redox-sensitive bicupin YhaK (pirin superfamily)